MRNGILVMTKYRHAEGLTLNQMGDDALLARESDGEVIGLNSVCARVWSLLEEPKDLSAIVEVLLKEFEVERETCEQQVGALLEQMREQGLIVPQ